MIHPLGNSLLELAINLRNVGLIPILAGGYGLYIKQKMVVESGHRTVLDFLPEPRSTQDLDMLLQIALMVDLTKFKELQTILEQLEYTPTERNRYWQWEKRVHFAGSDYDVVVDLLTGDVSEQKDLLKIEGGRNPRRARPKGNPKPHLHARPTPEALNFEMNCTLVPISGEVGEQLCRAEVFVASPLTYISMKLHALRDRVWDEDVDNGRHHALDLYRIVGLMSEEEYGQTREGFAELASHEIVIECAKIVRELFGEEDSLGLLRIKEHSDYDENMDLSQFASVLKEFFPEDNS